MKKLICAKKNLFIFLVFFNLNFKKAIQNNRISYGIISTKQKIKKIVRLSEINCFKIIRELVFIPFFILFYQISLNFIQQCRT